MLIQNSYELVDYRICLIVNVSKGIKILRYNMNKPGTAMMDTTGQLNMNRLEVSTFASKQELFFFLTIF